MNKKLMIGVVLALTLKLWVANTSADLLWSTEKFNEPESILVDEKKQLIYVSNINGNPTEKNKKGYISLMSKEGKILNQHWITGLNAPKGLGLYKNLLYIADLNHLHIVDVDEGKRLYSIEVYGSQLLNDISIDDNGTVYISDMLAGGIYRLKDNHLQKWISTTELPHPNGLYFDNDINKLIVATWGEGIQSDFSTTILGSLYQIDLTSKKITLLENTKEIGNLDGITKIGDTLYISDWITGTIFQYSNNNVSTLMNAGKNAADISSSGNELLIPMMFSKRVDSYKI